MNPIKAAAVQFNHRPGDKDYNLGRVRHFVQEARQQNVQLITFPEMCLTGYWHVRNLSEGECRALAEPIEGGTSTTALKKMAIEFDMTIGAGLIELADDGRMFNSYVVAMPDGEVAVHRKLHCFISEHLSSGTEFTVFDIPQGARVGVLICYDNNIVENARINALMGAEILLSPHQTGGCDSPSPHCMGVIDTELWENRHADPDAIEAEFQGPKGRQWLHRWLPARAHDNGLFLLFSNGVGIDDDEVRTGNAMILGPYGETLAETWKADDMMVVADLDPTLQPTSTGRRWLKSRRPDLYRPLTIATGHEEDTRTIRFRKEN
ncbi:nitrilase family protein [Roseiconus lacunae]|uniref:Nitrilase family protein n=1 Tax=Roseiconus lacunae TaxID=2605694 RepID=A0ABT7PJS2_9BACT|nr:nitrilase family protein [Roseiconus lacunae]MDM4016757.1 nitrilase family protein [Roseiconus lacunae]